MQGSGILLSATVQKYTLSCLPRVAQLVLTTNETMILKCSSKIGDFGGGGIFQNQINKKEKPYFENM